MKRWQLVVMVLATPLGICFAVLHGRSHGLVVSERPAADDTKRTPGTKLVSIRGRALSLPAGFDIEVVAEPPLVERPICADFDEEGRLYVAEAAGTSDKIEEHIKNKPHRVVRLEDSDGDGRFDKKTVFADKLMIPQGAMWFSGSLYAAAPPSIWKLTDTDGDGVADSRVEWFKGKATGGCANDVRGPYLGADGWIYWCKGGTEKRTYERPGRDSFVTSANHIFRCRPDGSGFEPVMTGGMDNPVEVAFTRGGERLFTTTQFQYPGRPRTDGLFHAVYGGVYPKDLAAIYDHPWTGPNLLPVLTFWGASAPAGLARYESRALGEAFSDNVFVAHFNFHKVTRHTLKAEGATFQSQDHDFLTSTDIDFHPTDVLEDADGSLLVIETGGWYRFCCPSSSLFKPEVLGAIYRIRRSRMPGIDDPRGLKLAWKTMSPRELARLLGDERPAVRRRSIQALAEKGAEAFPAITDAIRIAGLAEARRNAVWAATRIDHADARIAVRAALKDADEFVCQAALHSVSIWRDGEAMPQLLALLTSSSPHNRGAAAEALGRIGDKRAVPAILKALETPTDRMLEHSLTFALIDIADREATAAGLRSASPHTRRAALTALDQMRGGRLDVEAVVSELRSPDLKLRETAWWIAGRHPEWGKAMLKPLQEQLASADQKPDREELARRLARFAQAPAVRDWLGERLGDAATWREAQRTILRAMAESGLKEAPPAWVAGLTRVLGDKHEDLIGEASAVVKSLRFGQKVSDDLVALLLRIAIRPDAPALVRLQALAAVPNGLTKVEPTILELLLDQLKPDKPVVNRGMATEVLSRAKLDCKQLELLANSLKDTGPLELSRLLEVFGSSTDENVGRTLVAALQASPARSSLRVETLRRVLARFGPSLQKQAEQLIANIEADTADQRAKLEKLLTTLGTTQADARRGHTIFHGSKAACSACHSIAYVGGNVGPALTEIAKIRTERDLLESIILPNATLVQSYEGVVVSTKEGRTFNGVVVRDTPEAIVLATSVNQEARIARADIEAMEPSKVSIMPAGLDQQLTMQELADLLAFLKTCK